MRKINMVVIHCSATPEAMNVGVDEIRAWHVTRGWRDIGYHFIVRRDGSIEEGRMVDEIGAHAKGFNRESIGVCWVGGVGVNGSPEDNRTIEQTKTLRALIVKLKNEYGEIVVCGHRDLKGVRKSCPCFDVKTEL